MGSKSDRFFVSGLLGLAIVLWELASGRWVDAWLISSPTQIGIHLYQMVARGELWPHLTASLSSLAIGFPIGIAFGILSGMGLGFFPRLAGAIEPVVIGLHGIPKVVLAPLFILWFGIGIPSKAALVALLSFFHNFFNTYTGVRRLDQGLVAYGRLLGARGWLLFFGVIFPAISPHIFTGIRSSLPLAFIGVAVGEFIAAEHGLGLYVRQAVSLLDTTAAFAGALLFFFLIVLANNLLVRLERHFLNWLPESDRRQHQ